jgi:hypothetical protein
MFTEVFRVSLLGDNDALFWYWEGKISKLFFEVFTETFGIVKTHLIGYFGDI